MNELKTRILALLARIEREKPRLDCDGYCYAGNMIYHFDGWTLVVFNDCDEWDYLDSFTTPEGEHIGLWPMVASDYHAAWLRWVDLPVDEGQKENWGRSEPEPTDGWEDVRAYAAPEADWMNVWSIP